MLLTCVAYLPALRGDFLWDDIICIRDNPVMRAANGVWQIWTQPMVSPQVYPLVFTSYWVEFQLWGLNPLGYHIVNLVLHLLNTVLLFAILRRWAVPAAWLAAGLFALHPVHVESVAWIAERKDTLSMFFYLLSMFVWLRFLEQPAGRPRLGLYGLLCVFYFLTLCSKVPLCTFPVAALLIAWWREPRGWWRAIPTTLPLFVLSAAFALLALWREDQQPNPPEAVALVSRILIAGRAVWYYAWSFVWPVGLTAIYPRWIVDPASPWQFAFPAAALAVAGVLWAGRRILGAGPFVAVVFFGLTLAPMLGLGGSSSFMRMSWVADHFTYLASCGLCALVAALVARGMEHLDESWRMMGWGACALVLVGLTVLSWQQALIYHDAETFWRDNVEKNPQSWMGHNLLAGALARQGRTDEAIEHFAAAVAIKPDYAMAYNHWAILLDKLGQLDAARQQYELAVAADPRLADVHNNYGTVLFRQGQMEAAYAQFAEAVRLNPDYFEAHNHLGLAAANLGRRDEAANHYQEALRLKPDYAAAQRNLDHLQSLPAE